MTCRNLPVRDTLAETFTIMSHKSFRTLSLAEQSSEQEAVLPSTYLLAENGQLLLLVPAVVWDLCLLRALHFHRDTDIA